MGGIALDATAPENPAAAVAERGRKAHLGDATFSVPGGHNKSRRVTLT